MKHHVRSRKLKDMFNGILVLFTLIFFALILYDLNAESRIITVPSKLWMILSIISIVQTFLSLCMILCLTEEDRK